MINREISIVVCCKGEASALHKTIKSLSAIDTKPYEVIFCLNNVNLPSDFKSNFKFRIINDPGAGVYNAMNFALEHVQTALVLFLNASDEIVGDPLVDVDGPGLLPYRVVGAKFGFLSRTNFHFTVLGTSYCHQGVIYAARALRYDTKYSISADYLSIQDSFGDVRRAKRFTQGHVVFYKGGLSSIHFKERDAQIFRIMMIKGYYVRVITFFFILNIKAFIKYWT